MSQIERALRVTISCCLVSACSLKDETAARVAANLRAIEDARKVQAEIQQSHKCPEALLGWSHTTSNAALSPLETSAGAGKVKYRLYFDCSKDAQFSITIKLGIDAWTYVRGSGSDQIEIQYGHFTNPHVIKIPGGADIHAIALTAARA